MTQPGESAGQYRKKPVRIEAIRLSRAPGDNQQAVVEWVRAGGGECVPLAGNRVVIQTLEGDMTAERGDYVIRGVKGEFYPCKPDIFEATYEPEDTQRRDIESVRRLERRHGVSHG